MTDHAPLLKLLFDAARPPPRLSVSEWAEQYRYVSAEGGSPYPGPWRNDRVPELVEIMDCMSLQHPCSEVVVVKSAQVGVTECPLNLVGQIIHTDPTTVLIVTPSLDEMQKYNRVKLQPTIDATPVLKDLVKEMKSRDASGSTTAFKRFPGGFVALTGANSSAGLQMISVRVLVLEEVSEYPHDVGGRGDPVAQAEARTLAWRETGYKHIYVSTPEVEGTCRVTAKYEKSDKRRRYVPCPHCLDFIVLEWQQMKWRSADPPHRPYYVCQACGGHIEHHQLAAMRTEGKWIKTCFDDVGPVIAREQIEDFHAREAPGKQPGFHLWQAYSTFVGWEALVAAWLEAEGNPFKEKVFSQQRLGRAWKESGEAPDWEKLYLRREDYAPKTVPPGVLCITGMADVQKNRIEWAVYGWGAKMSGWLIDKGIIEGDPEDDAPWDELEAVTERVYEDEHGQAWHIDAFGVDAGYLSHRVYLFCRGRQPRVLALDGRGQPALPAIGTPKPQDISWKGKKIKKGCMLWPTGTWMLKSWVYGMLRKTVQGPDESGNWKPGALHFPQTCDREFFKQITAEYIHTRETRGRMVREWRQIEGQANEQLDIVVGALALAVHLGLDKMTPRQLQRLAEQRGANVDAVKQTLEQAKTQPAGEGKPAEEKEPPVRQAPPPRRVKRRRRIRGGRALLD